MKAPFSYYGGKGALAEWIASLMPAHRVYLEAFAGSAAVLFAKPRSTHEIINDVDGDVVNFFRVLRENPDELELACRLTPYSREEFARATPGEDLDSIERARRWWVRVNQSFAKMGTASTGWSTSIRRGSNNARSVWNRIDRFVPCVERLAGVTIENRDALTLIGEHAVDDAVIYVDPPYLAQTRSGLQRRPSGDYAHEFAREDEHRALAEVLHQSPATVILSGYPSGLYEDLYADWSRVERTVLRRTSNGRSNPKPHAVEVLWSNRPLPATGLFDAEACS